MRKLLLIIIISCTYHYSVAQADTTNQIPKEKTWSDFYKKVLVGKPWHSKYPGFAKSSGGIGISMPIITGFKPSVWTGLEYRSKYFRFNYYTSMATYEIATERDTSTQVSTFSLTYLRPLNFFKLGNRNNKGTSGWLLQPTLGGFIRTFKTSNKSSSISIGISPELQLQLPYSVIALKLDVGYNLCGELSDLYHSNGIFFFPQLSFQFDALKDFHNTKTVETGVYNYTVGGNTITGFTGRTSSSKESFIQTLQVMDPFWAVSFRAEMGTKKYPLATHNIGIGLSGRWSTLMFDSYISYGKFFAKGFVDVDDARKPTDMNVFNGTVNNFGININAGADVLLGIRKLFHPSAYKELGYQTPYFSIYLGMGLNFLIPGETKFTNPGAANSALDSWFTANPDIERTAQNDPSLTKSGMGMNFFIQFETASIGFILSGTYQKKIGVINSIGINYLFPLKKK